MRIDKRYKQFVESDNTELVSRTLKSQGHRLSKETIEESLILATDKNYREIVPLILEFARNYLSNEIIEKAFMSAVEQGYTKIVSAILGFTKDRLSKETIEEGFESAVDKVHTNIIFKIIKSIAYSPDTKRVDKMIDYINNKLSVTDAGKIFSKDFNIIFEACKRNSKLLNIAKSALEFHPHIHPILAELIKISEERPEFKVLVNDEYTQKLLYTDFENNPYHDTLNSLLNHINDFTKCKNIKDRYVKLLQNKNPIISDVLYASSIKKDSLIEFANKKEGETRGGYYTQKGKIVIFNHEDDGIILHEETHKLIHNIFGTTRHPYDYTTKTGQALYSNAVKKTLLNIAESFGVIDEINAQDSTWQIGTYLVSVNPKKNQALTKFLAIYDSSTEYNPSQQYAEVLPRLPQVIANGQYDENVQAITEPLLKYWNDVMVPRINNYLLAYDHSDFCSPLSDFIIDNRITLIGDEQTLTESIE